MLLHDCDTLDQTYKMEWCGGAVSQETDDQMLSVGDRSGKRTDHGNNRIHCVAREGRT